MFIVYTLVKLITLEITSLSAIRDKTEHSSDKDTMSEKRKF